MSEKLKPCPACGKYAYEALGFREINGHLFTSGVYITCSSGHKIDDNVFATTEQAIAGWNKAIEAWNRRADHV